MTDPDPLAWAAAVAYCGWDPSLVVTDETVLLDGNGTALLTLPSLHVTDVSMVTVTTVDSGAALLWLPGPISDPVTVEFFGGPGLQYDVTLGVGWSENGCLTWQGCGVWPEGSRNVAVTYSGGYGGPPADLLAAVTNLSARLGKMGATGRRLGSAGVNYSQVIQSGGLLTIEQMVFDRYRIPRVA